MNIDFKLLAKQKLSLLTIISTLDPDSELQKDLDGILLILDALQDEQEDQKINEQEQFTNGFDSWYETHHEIVEAISFELNKDDDDAMSLRVLNRRNSQGTGGIYELAKELTDKFEQENKGKEWDGEFMDTIEDFIDVEFKKEA